MPECSTAAAGVNRPAAMPHGIIAACEKRF
jgi:hypothetical protein